MTATDLGVQRDGRRLFSGLSLQVRAGEICVVLGPNGAGKSSLLLALAGWLAPSSGRVHLDGRPVLDWSPAARARRLAWQGGTSTADFGLRVHERLALAGGRRGPERHRRALATLELEGMEERRLEALSAGERQRVELAALSLREAPCWLLDEPTAHLDLRHQVRWIGQLRRERRAGRAMVVVLHDLPQAQALADYAVLLRGDGHCRWGPARDLLCTTTVSALYRTPIASHRDESGTARLAPRYEESQ